MTVTPHSAVASQCITGLLDTMVHAVTPFQTIDFSSLVANDTSQILHKSKLQEKIRGQRMNGRALRFNV